MTDRTLIARLNGEIVYLTQVIRRTEWARNAFAATSTPRERACTLAYLTSQRDHLNRLYAELSNAWDVEFAALGG